MRKAFMLEVWELLPGTPRGMGNSAVHHIHGRVVPTYRRACDLAMEQPMRPEHRRTMGLYLGALLEAPIERHTTRTSVFVDPTITIEQAMSGLRTCGLLHVTIDVVEVEE